MTNQLGAKKKRNSIGVPAAAGGSQPMDGFSAGDVEENEMEDIVENDGRRRNKVR